MEFKKYTEDLAIQWDEFVNKASINGTFLHTRKFFNHNSANEKDDSSLLFYKKERVVAVLPGCTYLKENRKYFHSHPRATYGGLIINNETGLDDAVEMVTLLIGYAKENEINEIIIRNPFRIFHKRLADEIDYALWFHGFQIKYREIETAIELGNYEEVERNYSDSTKRSIKKSAKSLVTKNSNQYKDYWDMLEVNLKKHNIKPTHSYEEFLTLVECMGDEKIKVFVAEKENKIAGGIVVFLSNEKAIQAQYIASDELYQEYRPLNAVIDFTIQWACEQGYRYLNLGTSNTDGGRGINSGLFRFKEGFGGRGVLRETMHLVL
jgi:hypothetical protein